MTCGINIYEGWRGESINTRLGKYWEEYVNIDAPSVQTVFNVVRQECEIELPCGSEIWATSGKALEAKAKREGLAREKFRRTINALRSVGILEVLDGVMEKATGGQFIGISNSFGALRMYRFIATMENAVGVFFGAASDVPQRDRVGTYFLRKELTSDDDLEASDFSRCRLNETTALYLLGVEDAPALVLAYGSRRCRQVRKWALRKVPQDDAAALIFSVLTKRKWRESYSEAGSEQPWNRDLLQHLLDEQVRRHDDLIADRG